MTKYYSLNGGQYLTYDQLHNEQGWTDHPTTQINIKSIEPWGGIEDDGLMDIGSEVIVDAMHASYFLNGTTGWWTINTLLTNLGCYPDIGTDDNIVNNGAIQCNAAIIYGELQHPYYLVEKATELGWMDAQAFEDNGWEVGPLPQTNLKGYTTSSGESNIQNVTLNNNGTRLVYSASGQVISFNPGYTFIDAYYLDNGKLVSYDSATAFRLYPDSTYVYIINKLGYSADIAVIDFANLEPQKAYINQYSHSANWSYTYNTPTELYDTNGNLIPYDSNKIYTLTASIKLIGANETVQSHTRYIEAVNKDGYLGYRSSVSGNACYFYYTVRDLTYYGYMYHNEATTITTSSSSYVYIYEVNGTTVKPYDTTKQYTIIHVWSSFGVLADEYIPQLFITRVAGGAVSDQLHLRMNTGTYSSATIWRVEYIETDLS